MGEPMLVRRSRRYCWFPSLVKLSDGCVGAIVSGYADIHVSASTMYFSRSFDSGRTWDEPSLLLDGGVLSLRLPSGETVLAPYYQRPRPGGMGAPCNVLGPGGVVSYRSSGVTVTGWPRPDRPFIPEIGTSGFVSNGQTVVLKDGGWLGTWYGFFGDDKRMSLVCAASQDAFNWEIRSVIAGADCPLEGSDGPSESALCRMPDGRLMCVFRLGSCVPFGQTWSSDEGRTWTPARSMENVFSVEPSLQAMAGGVIAVSAGRPGIYVWFNADGTGTSWEAIDIVAPHNRRRPSDAIDGEPFKQTSSYTEIIALDERNLLLIYDRLANGWSPIPDDMRDTNSVWVVRLTIG